MYDDNGSDGPKGTFEIYRAEAESLYKQGEYRKAIESYSLALELTPGDKSCLVARSKCHLQLGDMDSALADAESSMEEDKNFHKGIYQKAQALYYQGDFEMSLVFYHRGLKLRPELQEFRLGIQKAQEAIDNSVGCKCTEVLFPNRVELQSSKIHAHLDLSFMNLKPRKSDWSLETVFSSSFSSSNKTRSTNMPPSSSSKCKPSTGTAVGTKAPDTVKLTTEGDLSYFDQMLDEKKIKRKTMAGSFGRPAIQQQAKSAGQRQPVGSEKTIKQLLGELYGDRQYLEKLLKETDPQSEMGKTISNLVSEGLSYLDTRSDFWRQQKPMYARRHDRLMQRRKREITSSKLAPNEYILKELERIDQAQVEGRYQEALKRSQKCLATVQGFSEDDVPNKVEVVANLHSCIGNAYLELGEYNKSLTSHETDLSIGETNDMVEAVSRGLDNIGRVHARRSEFAKAIQVWERKVPMSKSPLESTWLYHEIGRCYLELSEFEQAKKFGEQSETAAVEAEDQMWQLQASVLTAQAEVKLGDYQGGSATFEKALELAKSQGDKSAENAISKALQDINQKILEEGVKEKQEAVNEEGADTNDNAKTGGSEHGATDNVDSRQENHADEGSKEQVKDTTSEAGKSSKHEDQRSTNQATDDDKKSVAPGSQSGEQIDTNET